jgi:phosphoglycolate phosphatase-like HAD superfamily hydrolase
MNADCAVVFDVDGVLLDLTRPEEDAFFAPFERLYGLTGLSRDWDSYRVRNDEEIIGELLERHLGRRPDRHEMDTHLRAYVDHLASGYREGALAVELIPGAPELLEALNGRASLGIATANILGAAEIRLELAGLWASVSAHAGGADGGGAKKEVLRRVMDRLELPPKRIVFIGDNLNDVEAGLANGVHFIGFALDPVRRERLKAAGAPLLSGDHGTTLTLIRNALQFS